jgi:hypothetical protein
MAMTGRTGQATLVLLALLGLAATPAEAALVKLAASGTIEFGGNATIPNGTPWAFDITYDTAAPDLASADPTFGQFANTTAPPALRSFHYQAGSYQVALNGPSDFNAVSGIHITFTAIHAIDINVDSPLFPPLAGGAVSFHADFNDFTSDPIFVSDALPTNPALGPGNFDQSTVNLTLLGPPSGAVGGTTISSLTVTPVPEPATAGLVIAGLLLVAHKRRGRKSRAS